MKKIALVSFACVLALLFAVFGSPTVVLADDYADAVTAVSGTFGAPTTLSNAPAVAAPLVTGAPNQTFIQISDNSYVTLQFTDNVVSIDNKLFTADLIIDTYDELYPSAAKVEVSNDGTTWVEVMGRPLNECDTSRNYVFEDLGQAFVDLTQTGLTQIQYVRLTDYPGSVDGEYTYPTLGFDLDALIAGDGAFWDCLPVIAIDIDIKPQSFPNCFNNDGKGVIPVAILGSETFDVTQIDVTTLAFEGLLVRVKGNGAEQCSIQDVSGDFTSPEGAPDGFDDLVCQFVDSDGVWSAGTSYATVSGNLLLEFGGDPIVGQDTVCITQ